MWKYVKNIMFQKTHFSEGVTAWVAPSLLHFRSIVAKAACHLERSGCAQGRLCASQRLPHYKDHTLILNNERDSKYFTLLKDWINAGAKP